MTRAFGRDPEALAAFRRRHVRKPSRFGSAPGDDFGPEAQAAFLEPDNDLFFSAASYWETCIKQRAGKLGLAFGWQETVDAELAANRVDWLGINKAHCQGLLRLPHHHGDPSDRLLISQAQVETTALLTADTNIWRYDVKTVW